MGSCTFVSSRKDLLIWLTTAGTTRNAAPRAFWDCRRWQQSLPPGQHAGHRRSMPRTGQTDVQAAPGRHVHGSLSRKSLLKKRGMQAASHVQASATYLRCSGDTSAHAFLSTPTTLFQRSQNNLNGVRTRGNSHADRSFIWRDLAADTCTPSTPSSGTLLQLHSFVNPTGLAAVTVLSPAYSDSCHSVWSLGNVFTYCKK